MVGAKAWQKVGVATVAARAPTSSKFHRYKSMAFRLPLGD